MAFSRREFLVGVAGIGVGLGAAMGLAGCAQNSGAVVENLPDYQPEGLPVPTPATHPGPETGPPPAVKRVPAFGTNAFGIYPRSAWTAAGPIAGRISPMAGVKLMTFHHSGGQHNGRDVAFIEDGFQETIKHLEIIRRFHTEDRKWGDIAYHFAIDRAGRVWQLRSLKYQGAHVRHHDEHNLGIVVLGNFNVQRPTGAQLERIKSFGLLARSQYRLGIKDVFTHRELGPTDCPGTHMQPYMVAVRQQKLI